VSAQKHERQAAAGGEASAACTAMVADTKARDAERHRPTTDGWHFYAWRCDCRWTGGSKDLEATIPEWPVRRAALPATAA
jgi:hypothetical protein